ncbi:MAG: hypothetical protein C0471_06875 [Erythrobacter sp.]|jgi:hypothetical protein|nr:hypothetical protein [Erythrobacter sp.]
MTNDLPELMLPQIADGGFAHAGRWDLNAEGVLFFAGNAPKRPGVYIFVQAGTARYVGVASRNLAQRLYMYGRPGVSQRTNIRLNGVLRDELANGEIIDVYVASPPDLEWNGWKVSGAEGLEAAIIRSFRLSWNRRGTVPVLMPSASTGLQSTDPAEDGVVSRESADPGGRANTADRIRDYAESRYFAPARSAGQSIVEVSAREIHDGLRLRNAFPSVCQALSGRKIAEMCRVTLTRRIGPTNSSTTSYVYELLH